MKETGIVVRDKRRKRQDGIKSLADVKQRCFIDENGCWKWRYMLKDGSARMHVILKNQPATKMAGRRAVMLLSGAGIKRGESAFATLKCMSKDCVNPQHCQIGTKKEAMTAAGKKGAWSQLKHYALIVAMAKNRRKLDDMQRVEIGLSKESTKCLAERYSVSTDLIQQVRRQQRGKGRETMPANSIWTWRPDGAE